MIRSDFHMHSTFSTDARSEMSDMLKAASDKGLKHICFTEHMDWDNTYDEGPDAFILDTESYKIQYDLLSSSSKDLSVGFGVELGLQPHLVDFCNEYTHKYAFDFIIGSSHIVDRIDPGVGGFYEKFPSEKAAHRRYFEAELECIEKFDCFDVYGHLDYALRYGPTADRSFTYEEYSDILDKILMRLIEKGKGIEINSGGFRKGMLGPNPAFSIIKRYHELGGEIITVGSDAHHTSEIAADFDRAENVLSDAGFRYYTIFKERKPVQIPL